MNQRRSSTSRTPARPGGTSTGITVVLVVVTALLGLFILKKISDDSGGGGGGSGSATTQPADTSADTTTSSTVPVADMALAKILVANGAGVKGLAGTTTTALQGAFPTATYLTPTDANAKYQASAVYYQSGFEGQAGRSPPRSASRRAGCSRPRCRWPTRARSVTPTSSCCSAPTRPGA